MVVWSRTVGLKLRIDGHPLCCEKSTDQKIPSNNVLCIVQGRRRGSRLDRSGILNCSQSEIHRCIVCRMTVGARRRLQVIVMARNKFSRHDFASGCWHLNICWNVSRVSGQCGHWLSIHWCPPVTDFLDCVASWL